MTTSASLRSLGVRTVPAALATMALAGASLWGAPAAVAVPGDSGDIKIHKAGTRFADTKDHYEVCTFNLSAFNFETVRLVSWTITPQPKTPPQPTLTGAISLVNGRGHTADYSLPNGHYQLAWSFPGGVPKQKIFKVDCTKGMNDDKPRPRGAVLAGGGGAADVGGGAGSGTAGDGGSSIGMGPALVTGAAGIAGLIFVRRARRRAHGAA